MPRRSIYGRLNHLIIRNYFFGWGIEGVSFRDSHRNLESGATKITTTPGRHSRFGSALPLTKWDDETYIFLPPKKHSLEEG